MVGRRERVVMVAVVRRGMVGGMGAKGRGWKGTGAGMAAGAGCLGTVARV